MRITISAGVPNRPRVRLLGMSPHERFIDNVDQFLGFQYLVSLTHPGSARSNCWLSSQISSIAVFSF